MHSIPRFPTTQVARPKCHLATIYFERDNIHFHKIVEKVAKELYKSPEEVTDSEIVESLRTWSEKNFEGIIAGVRGNSLKAALERKIQKVIAEIAEADNKSQEKVASDEIAESLRGDYIEI